MPYVRKPRRDVTSVIDFLNAKLDCVPQPDDFMGKYFLDRLFNNVYYCFLNEPQTFDKKEFSFKCFKVIQNEKSHIYYSEMEPGEKIHVIFEEKTGYIESNCNLLSLELFIEQGIDDADLLSENEYCKSYFVYLERYKEHL